MLLTLKVKLNPSNEKRLKLLKTMETFNAACNDISKEAYASRTFNKIKLQHRLYYRIREQYKLPAQLAIRAISKVVESYRTERKHQHTFDPRGALVYDQRIMSFKGIDKVSLATAEGRETIPLLAGDYARLGQRVLRGQADLILVRNKFYLCLVVEQPEAPPLTPEGILGVDLGVVKLASTSDGVSYTGEEVDAVREHYTEVKAELQRVGSKNSKRKLRRIAGREARFKRYTNHVISKGLVAVAEGTKRAITLEDLGGIRSRTTVRREQRGRLGKWAFGQLRAFVEYKARIAGVPVLLVDPRDTSRRCSVCGYTDRGNRVSQSEFRCRVCGYESNADLNAAVNIRWRAVVNQPIAVCRRVLELELQAHPL
jgi:IS605 OrfB family transposase